MFKTVAAQAALRAFSGARNAGARADISVDVALARYRSYFPLAPEDKVRNVLARALAFERLRKHGLVFNVDDLRALEPRVRDDEPPRRSVLSGHPGSSGVPDSGD